MALNSNALVELDPTKIFLKIPLAETSQDTLVENFINEISDLIEDYCRRKFRAQQIVDIYDGGRTREILLYQWPVNSIVSVHEDLNRVFDADSLLDASTYTVRQDEMQEGFYLQRHDVVFTRGTATVRVEYTFGYPDFADVPGALQLATKRAVAYFYTQQQNADFTVSNKSKGDENITLIDGLPKSATVLLSSFVRLEAPGPVNPIRNL
jgi:hypothetical protein